MTTESKEVEVGTGAQETPSPNADYKNNPLLDENGNPKEEQPADDASNKDTTTPPNTGETPPAEDESTPSPAEWTNQTNLQRLEKFLADANLKPSDVAKAVAENDGRMTADVLKALEEKHGVGVAALIADQIIQVHKDSVNAIKQRDAAAYKVLESEFAGMTKQSGEETFKELNTWAVANVPKEERAELNVMLQKGGLSAQLALKYLATQFKESANITIPAGLVGGDKTSNTDGLAPLSRAEYTSQLRALEAKGHVYGQSQEMAKLDARREAGRKRGI